MDDRLDGRTNASGPTGTERTATQQSFFATMNADGSLKDLADGAKAKYSEKERVTLAQSKLYEIALKVGGGPSSVPNVTPNKPNRTNASQTPIKQPSIHLSKRNDSNYQSNTSKQAAQTRSPTQAPHAMRAVGSAGGGGAAGPAAAKRSGSRGPRAFRRRVPRRVGIIILSWTRH